MQETLLLIKSMMILAAKLNGYHATLIVIIGLLLAFWAAVQAGYFGKDQRWWLLH